MSERERTAPRAWRQILTVARRCLAEARSRRLFWIVLPAALAAFAAVPFLPSDETPQGRLRLTLSVALAATEVAALIVTILLSGLALTTEIESKTIYLVETKPVPRWAHFLGTYLGIVAAVALFIAAMGAVTYLLTRGTIWREEAKAGSSPVPLDLSREVLRPRTERPAAREEVFLPAEGAEAARWSRVEPPERGERTKPVSVKPGGSYRWRFIVPKGSADDVLTFRLRLRAGLAIHFEAELEVRNPDPGGPSLRRRLTLAADRAADVPVERRYVGSDGAVELLVHNTGRFSEPTDLRVLPGHSMKLAAAGDPFGLSLAKVLLLLLFRMAFLAAVIAAATTFLSFPVACTVGGVTAFAGYTLPLVREALQWAASRASEPVAASDGGGMISSLLQKLATLLEYALRAPFPTFDESSAASYLTNGLSVPWALVGAGFLWLVLARGGVCVIIGILVYRRRELGA